MGKPDTQVLLERQNGIEAGLKENCKENYEIVATIDGVVNNEVQSKAESVLQANPDCKVWVGVGAGAMIGSNTALLAKYGGAGKIPEDSSPVIILFGGGSCRLHLICAIS